ncbi:hypothetical protein F4810DRAFT_683858 [Camillea tinctor]|nr:hypothetical protein F4810DRAFT_683858 [Camillea tinctor]
MEFLIEVLGQGRIFHGSKPATLEDCLKQVAKLMASLPDTSPPFHFICNIFQRHWKFPRNLEPYDLSRESLRQLLFHIPSNYHTFSTTLAIWDNLARYGTLNTNDFLTLFEIALEFDELLIHFDWQGMDARCQKFFSGLKNHYTLHIEETKTGMSRHSQINTLIPFPQLFILSYGILSTHSAHFICVPISRSNCRTTNSCLKIDLVAHSCDPSFDISEPLLRILERMCSPGAIRSFKLVGAHLINAIDSNYNVGLAYKEAEGGSGREALLDAIFPKTRGTLDLWLGFVSLFDMTLPAAAAVLNPIIEYDGRVGLTGAETCSWHSTSLPVVEWTDGEDEDEMGEGSSDIPIENRKGS